MSKITTDEIGSLLAYSSALAAQKGICDRIIDKVNKALNYEQAVAEIDIIKADINLNIDSLITLLTKGDRLQLKQFISENLNDH